MHLLSETADEVNSRVLSNRAKHQSSICLKEITSTVEFTVFKLFSAGTQICLALFNPFSTTQATKIESKNTTETENQPGNRDLGLTQFWGLSKWLPKPLFKVGDTMKLSEGLLSSVSLQEKDDTRIHAWSHRTELKNLRVFEYLVNCNHLLSLGINRNHLLNDKAELCNYLRKNVPQSA